MGMINRPMLLTLLLLATIGFLGAAAWLQWGDEFRPDDLLAIEPLPASDVAAVRLTVATTGVHVISEAQLRAARLPFEAFSAEFLRLSRDGDPVPFLVVGDRLYFYAEAVASNIEAPAVLWLEPGSGSAMAQRSSRPTGAAAAVGIRSQRWEENSTFIARSRGDDVWFGPLIWAPGSQDIVLDGIAPHAGNGELTVYVWSNNENARNPDHHLVVALNGVQLTELFWDGITDQRITAAYDSADLRLDNNTLTLTAPGDTGSPGEANYLDWAEIRYPGLLALAEDEQLTFRNTGANVQIDRATAETLVFDVTNAARPQLLINTDFREGSVVFAAAGTDRQYVALRPTAAQPVELSIVPIYDSLLGPDRGADYIAIVPDDSWMLKGVQPLLSYREETGLEVVRVSVTQIYDEFGYGRQTPWAIRRFLAHAVANWSPAPRYALLVGDANYDLHGYLSGSNSNVIPTYLVYTEHAGYVASDTWFTLFDDSLEPGIAIGRLPVQSASQLATIVTKTIFYDRSRAAEWDRRALLIADDEPQFDRVSDDLARDLAAVGFSTEKLYMSRRSDMNEAILSAINAGVGIINYVGHGSVKVWGDERVFHAEDAAALDNKERLPIFTTFTCLNGYFNHPQDDALAETLLYAENGGVAAAIAPSGRSRTSEQLPLADAFYDALLNGPSLTVGEALQSAKRSAAGNRSLHDVVHTFNLLGDPALRFRLPSAESDSAYE